MERDAIYDLLKWKNSKRRKPLIIQGCRQVGKTFLMIEFAKRYYENYVYFNFDESTDLASVFEKNKNPEVIIQKLSGIAHSKIEKNVTLVILDEIQNCPEALNSLKYFKEQANEYHIIVAGSLLGTLTAKPKSYPVGMVDIIHLYPFTFSEFLKASDPYLYEIYEGVDLNTDLEEIFHNKLLDIFNQYLIVGGMPECVDAFLELKDFNMVKPIQANLLDIYTNDIMKHNTAFNSGKLLLVFRNIATQLAKANEKFIYGALKQGGRAKEFEDSIEWLISAGLVYKVNNVSKLEHPLSVYDKLEHFKLFLLDVGLIKYMSHTDTKAILLNEPFQFKGALTENYVLQQLKGKFEVDPRYYSDKNSELDFVMQIGSGIVPIEVKASEDKSAPSFKRYIASNHPKIAIRFSKRGLKKDGDILNVPLYLANKLDKLIEGI